MELLPLALVARKLAGEACPTLLLHRRVPVGGGASGARGCGCPHATARPRICTLLARAQVWV